MLCIRLVGECHLTPVEWIEFHDSELLTVQHSGRDLELMLNAFVHRWEVKDGRWRGTGWLQPIRITLFDVADHSIAFTLPLDIFDGGLRVGSVEHRNLLPLPFTTSEPVSLRLELVDGGFLEIAGRAVQMHAEGEARYVEDLPLELRPGPDENR